MQKGKQSLCLQRSPFIISTVKYCWKKEGEGTSGQVDFEC